MFTQSNQHFRYRAAAIILHDGAVLMAKNNHDDYYYSVGGTVGVPMRLAVLAA